MCGNGNSKANCECMCGRKPHRKAMYCAICAIIRATTYKLSFADFGAVWFGLSHERAKQAHAGK